MLGLFNLQKVLFIKVTTSLLQIRLFGIKNLQPSNVNLFLLRTSKFVNFQPVKKKIKTRRSFSFG